VNSTPAQSEEDAGGGAERPRASTDAGAGALSPQGNTGDKYPTGANRTKVDYLTVSCSENALAIERVLEEVFVGAPARPAYTSGPGMRHFAQSVRITVAGIPAGVVLVGGETQRGRACVDISGAGCALVADWDRAEDALLSLPSKSFRRADIAADFFGGELGHERVKQAHAAGKFTRGGRNPVMTEVITNEESRGRTIYIGQRGGDALGRFYEKGKQEFNASAAKLLRRLAETADGVSVRDDKLNDGASFDLAKWYRAEVELRSKNRPIPEDWISRRDEYFAGVYPFMAELLPEVEGRILVRPKHMGIVAIEGALDLIKRQWGPTLYTGLAYYGGDFVALCERVVGDRHSPRLVQAGALLAL
jgi:DNA relaxase NicK